MVCGRAFFINKVAPLVKKGGGTLHKENRMSRRVQGAHPGMQMASQPPLLQTDIYLRQTSSLKVLSSILWRHSTMYDKRRKNWQQRF